MSPASFARRRQNAAALSSQASTRRRGIQIGPRIRIGGSIGHAAQSVKEGVGKVAKAAAPFVGLIPGVGSIAAGGLGALGTALDTSHGGVSLGDIAGGALKAGGLSALGGIAGKIPGVSSLGGKIGGALSHIPGVSAATNAIGKIPGVSELGGPGGIASKVGGFLGEHGDDLLAAAGGITSALDAKSARDLENRALASAQGAYDERAGLRTQGIQGMMNSAPPDLSAIYLDQGNPYSRKKIKGVSAGAL